MWSPVEVAEMIIRKRRCLLLVLLLLSFPSLLVSSEGLSSPRNVPTKIQVSSVDMHISRLRCLKGKYQGNAMSGCKISFDCCIIQCLSSLFVGQKIPAVFTSLHTPSTLPQWRPRIIFLAITRSNQTHTRAVILQSAPTTERLESAKKSTSDVWPPPWSWNMKGISTMRQLICEIDYVTHLLNIYCHFVIKQICSRNRCLTSKLHMNKL